MSSVDGRLLNERWTEPYDGTPASALLQVYASIGRELGTDAWMFGKNTLRAIFPYKWSIDGHTVPSDYPTVFIGEHHSERMFIVADPEADIYFTSSVVRLYLVKQLNYIYSIRHGLRQIFCWFYKPFKTFRPHALHLKTGQFVRPSRARVRDDGLQDVVFT